MVSLEFFIKMALESTQSITETSTRNISWGINVALRGANNLTIFMCLLSWYLGAWTSWKLQALARPLQGMIYLLIRVPVEYTPVCLIKQRKLPRATIPNCQRKPLCYHLLVQMLNEEFAANLGIWIRSGKLTASCLWPVTNVFPLKVHWAKYSHVCACGIIQLLYVVVCVVAAVHNLL